MNAPDDPTPPTPDPLSDGQKLRMRADLLSSVESPRRVERRWLVPGLAAAAVVAIVGVGAVVVQHGGDGPSGSPTPFAPAGHGGASVAPSAKGTPASASPSTPAAQRHSRRVIGAGVHIRPTESLPTQGDALPSSASVSCEQAIAGLDNRGLDGAAVTADRSYGDFATSLYETKSAWIVCDDFASADGGAPTLLAAHDKADPYQPDLASLGVSENTLMSGEAQFVAAGRDFDGVKSISYAFPDGHTENAVAGQSGLWSMVYLPTSGPLADPNTNETTLDPIQVSVLYTDGRTDSFTLQWGLDTCAQITHGC